MKVEKAYAHNRSAKRRSLRRTAFRSRAKKGRRPAPNRLSADRIGLWPLSLTHKQNTTPFASYTLEYDQTNNTVGNLTKVTELTGATVTYGYDPLYRLISETRTGANAYSTTYQYDLAGNLPKYGGYQLANFRYIAPQLA